MKKVVLLTITLIFVFSCGIDKKSDLEKENLNGKVKSINIKTYSVSEKFGEIIKGRLSDNTFHNSSSLYNEEGYKTEENFFNLNGSIYRKYIYKYDIKRNKIEEGLYGGDGQVYYKNIYKYDNNGRRVEGERIAEDNRNEIKFEYDNYGNLIEEYYFTIEGTLSKRTEYMYNKQNHLIKKDDYSSDGYLLIQENYKYDNEGNIVDLEYGGGIENVKSTYKFDNDKNIIERNDYNGNGSLNTRLNYKYKFGYNENWIERLEYHNDFPKYITVRKVEYY